MIGLNGACGKLDVVTIVPFLGTCRKTTKESLAQTSSTITESLMGISRMMSQQVQQSEEAMQTLGKEEDAAPEYTPLHLCTVL